MIIIILYIILFHYIIYNYFKKKKGKNNNYLDSQISKRHFYIYQCLNHRLINKNIKNLNKPILSVIIPIFNCEKTIISTIRSVQNQNISEIEIILINDRSNDSSLKIIEDLQKEDPRIVIINNNKNMGTLYSRCIGVLSSKGRYIFSLDNDDLYYDENLLDYIYKKAKERDFDIIGFKSFTFPNNNNNLAEMKENRLSKKPDNLILYQPELARFPINKDGTLNHIHIWSNCIKQEIYKNGVNTLGLKQYSKFITWAEDISMIYLLFNIAHSFRFVNKFGVVHFSSKNSASSKSLLHERMFGEIFLLNIIIDHTKNNEDKNLAVFYALHIKKVNRIREYKNENHFLYLKKTLNKILNCKYIKEENKKIINQTFKNFFFEYNSK